MRKILISFTMMILAMTTNARIWKNPKGETLEGELIEVRAGRPILRLANGKVHSFAMTDFCEADQQYVEDHLKQKAEAKREAELKNRKAVWHDDFKDAQEEADKFGYPIYFLYTAPSWCPYCRYLEDNILSEDEFEEYANKNLVFLIADYSDRSDGEEWADRHPDLVKNAPCKGYPNAFLLDAEGKVMGKIGSYDDNWTPISYIEKIEKIRNNPRGNKKKRKKKSN